MRHLPSPRVTLAGRFVKITPMKSFVAPFSVETYKSRRSELLRRLSKVHPGDFTVLFWSGYEVPRNSTNTYPFRANSDFLYLTGFAEPETLILLQRARGKIRSAIGVRPRDLSANRGSELWEGERVGVERAPKALGFDEAFDIHGAEKMVSQWLSDSPSVFWNLGIYPLWDNRILQIQRDLTASMRGIVKLKEISDPRPVLHEMRKVKSAEEINIMRRSAEIAAQGHIRAMKTTYPGHFEYEVQAEVEREFKKLGAEGLAYSSIVAGGNNACTLHYNANKCRLNKSDLLLIDAGAELRGFASDITRCFPVSGKFTPAQREVYSWVLKAQIAAVNAVRPGVPVTKPHDIAVQILCTGLSKMKIIRKSPTVIFKKGLYKAFFPHGTSHWLGMDVHDCGIYKTKEDPSKSVTLVAGNVLTIEPGLYFRSDDRKVPSKYRGIGIRIEDDVAVTKSGRDVLTKSCPKSIDEIEALCAPKL
jgi:Xaa-Pro aminopeptidase